MIPYYCDVCRPDMQEMLNRSNEVIQMNIKQELKKMEDELKEMSMEAHELEDRLGSLSWDFYYKVQCLEIEESQWT